MKTITSIGLKDSYKTSWQLQNHKIFQTKRMTWRCATRKFADFLLLLTKLVRKHQVHFFHAASYNAVRCAHDTRPLQCRRGSGLRSVVVGERRREDKWFHHSLIWRRSAHIWAWCNSLHCRTHSHYVTMLGSRYVYSFSVLSCTKPSSSKWAFLHSRDTLWKQTPYVLTHQLIIWIIEYALR